MLTQSINYPSFALPCLDTCVPDYAMDDPELLSLTIEAGTDNPRVIALLLADRADEHAAKSEFTAAISCKQQEISVAAKLFHPTHTIIAALLNDLGEFYIRDRQHELALNCLNESLTILESKNMSSALPTAAVHSNLTNAHIGLGQYELARTHLAEAMRIRKLNK